ncbi:PilZ domain-containing protein [Rosistilla ulvae]|nr:PilZ domain-containing protein [Rosistilla ulvae]
MTRLINQTLDYSTMIATEEEQPQNRSESRLRRTLPVIVIPCDPAKDDESPDIQFGFTIDVSCYGLSVLLPQTVHLEEAVLLIGDPTHRKVMRGTCRYRKPLGMGTCQYGIQLDEVLKDHDYAPLLEYVAALESKSEQLLKHSTNFVSPDACATG